MQSLFLEIYDKSINYINETAVYMAKDGDKNVLVITGPNAAGFKAEDIGSGKFKAELTHENACLIRKLFPWTVPVRGLQKFKSFGLGDRLGIATPGHIDLFKTNDVFPVFAQQSIRELNLTNRTYEDVLDAATFAVFREGYKKGYGADGDHLKIAKDVEYALSLGFTIITLDCSDYIKSDAAIDNAEPLSQDYIDKYLSEEFDIEGIPLVFTKEELSLCVAIYKDAISFAAEIYSTFFKTGKYDADLEISIDETAFPTTPLQHYFVARELLDRGVIFTTLAPRFCGEFQKGIDYIGDKTQFENDIKIHAAISRSLGYKLSIHSGSDKFSIFPIIGKQTRGNYHVKTAGTNWLEAMRVIASVDVILYREIHNYALSVFNEAKKYYQVTADVSKIPDVSAIKDEDLPGLFENNDVRQLIHITYGFILNNKSFKDRLFKLLYKHENEYRSSLVKHIGKHLELLN